MGGHPRSPGSISPVRAGAYQSCAKVVQMTFVSATETADESHYRTYKVLLHLSGERVYQELESINPSFLNLWRN